MPPDLRGLQREQGQHKSLSRKSLMSLSSLQGQQGPLRFAESVPEMGHTSYGEPNP